MNISISDVTLEELTILCSRIGEISINECIKEEKEQEVQSLVESGMTKQEAEEKHEEVIQEKVEEVLNSKPVEKPVAENLEDKVSKLASEKFASQGRIMDLISILKEFNVNAITELESSRYPELYERLKNA